MSTPVLVDVPVTAGDRVLGDVRLTPLSRKLGLSKTRLAACLAEAGTGYLHLHARGNPKEHRAPFWSGDLQTGLRCYVELLATPDAQAALGQIEDPCSVAPGRWRCCASRTTTTGATGRRSLRTSAPVSPPLS